MRETRARRVEDGTSLPTLREEDVRLFTWIAQRGESDPQAACEPLGLSPAEVDDALTTLAGLHLVRRIPGLEERWMAVAPGTAIAGLVAPYEVSLRSRLAEVEQLRGELSMLGPLYAAGQRMQPRDSLCEVLDLGTVLGLISDATAQCRAEVRTCHPGGGRSPRLLEQAYLRDQAMIRRGVRMRTLYQHTARHHAPTQEYVRRLSAEGAQVRTLSVLFGRMIAFDSETVFLPHQEDPDGAIVVRDPSTVAYLCAAFDTSWSVAEPYSPAWSASSAREEVKGAIVRLLAEGFKDEVIARRLAMSLRTCRKHIAELMDEWGAESRFQAGYVARGQSGPVTG